MNTTEYPVIKKTKGKCLKCGNLSPARVERREGGVYMVRFCTTCGRSESRVGTNDFYYTSLGPDNSCGTGCGCKSVDGKSKSAVGKNGANPNEVIERLSTCTALIEIVHGCNMACPTCYADAPSFGKNMGIVPIDQILNNIKNLVKRKGKLEILQLSGGEPTLHPEIVSIIDTVGNSDLADTVLINTNGIRIARDDKFLEALSKLNKLYPKLVHIYLQFDGVQEEAQELLRGEDMRYTREQVLKKLDKVGIPSTLAMTVVEANMPYLYQAVEYGLRYKECSGIVFQPKFYSGRTAKTVEVSQPIVVGDIIHSVVEQSSKLLTVDDFTSLPCGDPNCHSIGYILRIGDALYPWRKIDGPKRPAIQKFLADKINYSLDGLASCGCDDTELGDIIKRIEQRVSIDRGIGFRMMIKPFMDASTWDEDRIARCCTHVIRPDGSLDSFCRYYAK